MEDIQEEPTSTQPVVEGKRETTIACYSFTSRFLGTVAQHTNSGEGGDGAQRIKKEEDRGNTTQRVKKEEDRGDDGVVTIED